MSYIVGIDIGGSTTKIVGVRNGVITNPLRVDASDPLTSAYGAFGRFLAENGLRIKDIDRVMFTGVGSTFLSDELHGIPATKVDEFMAIGLGGRHLSGCEDSIVVSMGTGTAFVSVKGGKIGHFGGTGCGGGTLLGLCDKMLSVRRFEDIAALALNGDLSKVDLTIGDISRGSISNMEEHVTASNFGKLSDMATSADVALGVLNLVVQVIGVMAVFAARCEGVDRIVLTGSMMRLKSCAPIFAGLERIYNCRFILPEDADFATAIGAALYINGGF